MCFRCIPSLISSQLRRIVHDFQKSNRNVDGLKKGIRMYISSSESRFRPYEQHLVLRTHENYASMHAQSSFIRDAPKRARFPRKAFGCAFDVGNLVSGLENHIGG
jgi:hypothetical protein